MTPESISPMNGPDGNLFNQQGLPASPFRTDVD